MFLENLSEQSIELTNLTNIWELDPAHIGGGRLPSPERHFLLPVKTAIV